jgi:hypothetical protein
VLEWFTSAAINRSGSDPIGHKRKSSSLPHRLPDRRESDGLLLPKLLDLGLLAPQLTQVVQLGAPHVTAGHDLDPVDRGAVDRVGPLDTDAEADLPDLEGLPQAATLASSSSSVFMLHPRGTQSAPGVRCAKGDSDPP